MSSEIGLFTEALIKHELLCQHLKWGPQHHPPAVWFLILSEEVGELAQAILRETFPDDGRHGDSSVEKELVQVAAVVIQWLQSMMDDAT